MLRVGQHPDRLGAAYVEDICVTELLELAGQPPDGLVERQRVRGVEGQVDVGHPRGAAVALQPHPTARGSGFFVGVGAVGVGVEPGLVDQPGRTRGRQLVEPVRHRAEEPVGVQCGIQTQVSGLTRDRAGPPHRDPPRTHQLPQPRQPEGELEGVAQELLGVLDWATQRGGQLKGRGRSDKRGTVTGQRDRATDFVTEDESVVTPAGVRRTLCRGVQQGPLQGQAQLADLGLLLLGAGRDEDVEDLSLGAMGVRLHGEILLLRCDSRTCVR
ncbi:hypothetical protein [Nocardioides aequoreus]|uniref:hypothetical protein n=1 Tax=Nocardioides aequoreus TaxID=397278 RepID=UPI001B7FF406|nr:hypothetical protein [Nocardioides aequoreus]